MKRRKFLQGLGSTALIGAASSARAGFLNSSSLADVPGCSPEDSERDTRIKHIIVLMLENRSFDHMLGYANIPDVDGVNPSCKNPYRGKDYLTTNDASYSGDLNADPGHDFMDVKTQLYFGGNENSKPTMLGFIESYASNPRAEPPNVMKCFAPEQLPVLTTLARHFVVCDRWFSSIPGPTLPNRLFAHTGTSLGRLDMSVVDFHTGKTIYEVLGEYDVGASIYSDGWSATTTFSRLMKHPDQYFGTLDDFYQDCYDDNLPGYCFLEPRYSSGMINGVYRPQNDQHPNSDVAEGEQLISDVYYAIRNNPKVWKSSMLVITYDEHGGLYDHVAPLAAIPPGDGSKTDFDFGFDRYGVRVPAVIVSPYSTHHVLHDVFDHTSLIATARKLLTGVYRDDELYHRARCANTFDKALNRQAGQGPRPDNVELPRVERHALDRSPSGTEMNHLQIMHLKQAILVNSSLVASQQINPKSILGKDVTNTSPDDAFEQIKPHDADRYIRTIYDRARNTGKLRKGGQGKKAMTT